MIVFIVSLPRSGSTFLGSLISEQKMVNYLGEQNYLWKFPDYKVSSDEVSKFPIKQVNNLRKRFPNKGSIIYIDKTPSNIFRIEALKNLFPDALYVFLRRNEEEIYTSLKSEWYGISKSSKDNAEIRKLNSLSKFIRLVSVELHKIRGQFVLSPLLFKLVIFKFLNLGFRLFFKAPFVWGPVYKGMIMDRIRYGREYTVRKQLDKMTESFNNNIFIADIVIEYSNLVSQSHVEAKRILNAIEQRFIDSN